MRSITLKGPKNLALSFSVPAKGESSKKVSLLLLPDAPTAYDACQSRAFGSLVLSSSDSWHPGLVVGCAERSELNQAPYSGFPQ